MQFNMLLKLSLAQCLFAHSGFELSALPEAPLAECISQKEKALGICSNSNLAGEGEESSLLALRTVSRKNDAKRGSISLEKMDITLEEIDKIKLTFLSALADGEQHATASALSASNDAQHCLDARAWLEKFANEPSWRQYSQGDQDAVLASLFSAEFLGTTNKEFVEFGFPDHDFSTSYGNGRNLKEQFGFTNFLLLDGMSSNPEIHLHKRFVTASSIVGIFDEFKVPREVDYMSVDIDSCDLWLFFAITEKYRPRVMTVEYNSNHGIDDYSTQRCADPMASGAYRWNFDNISGASLSAIELAAQKRNYSLVYASPRLDMFLVRNDLLCPGTSVTKETFKAATSLPIHGAYDGAFGPISELLIDFKQWVAATA